MRWTVIARSVCQRPAQDGTGCYGFPPGPVPSWRWWWRRFQTTNSRITTRTMAKMPPPLRLARIGVMGRFLSPGASAAGVEGTAGHVGVARLDVVLVLV